MKKVFFFSISFLLSFIPGKIKAQTYVCYAKNNANTISLQYFGKITQADSTGCDSAMYVPNVLEPNCENMNCDFRPQFTCGPPAKYELWIFDRWGNLIFHTNDYTKGWDGKLENKNFAPIDTYVWKIKFQHSPNGKFHEYVGHFSLIR